VQSRRHPILGVTEYPVEGEAATRSALEMAEDEAPSAFPLRPDALPFELLRDAGEAT
jgi:hypothetical protein